MPRRYRQLNTWYQNHGHSDISGEFHYREWVCKRLEAQGRLADGLSRRHPWRALMALNLQWLRTAAWFLWLAIHELLFGYGERPGRIPLATAFVILVFALLFFLFPVSDLSTVGGSEILSGVGHSLYFSLVSFTTLGYGGWIEHPNSWIRYWGGLKSFIGLFITAMYLVTFTRKWMR